MNCALIVVSLVSGAVLWTYCRKAKPGFGPYNTSTLLLLTAVSVTAILAVSGHIQGRDSTSILLATIGFAVGLFAGGKSTAGDKTQ